MTAPARPVTLAPLARRDAARAVDTVFAGLSPRSRHLRFHSPVPRLPAGVRDRLTDLDGRRRAAVVAVVAGPEGVEPVGIAELAGAGSGPAEAAVAVVDAWQRRGIGRRLLAAAAGLAEQIGYREVHGAVLPENTAMIELVRHAFPGTRLRFDGEVVQFSVPLGAAAWTVTHEDLMADLLSQ